LFFGLEVFDFILDSYGGYFVLCAFGSGGGYGDLDDGVCWGQISSEALLVEVYARVKVIEFSLQVLEFMDAVLTCI
jgi:hypothetical protein